VIQKKMQGKKTAEVILKEVEDENIELVVMGSQFGADCEIKMLTY